MQARLSPIWSTGARILCVAASVLALAPGVASAYFTGALVGGSNGSTVAGTLPQGSTPTAVDSGGNVTVSWTQNTVGGQTLGSYSGGGYTVQRYAATGGSAINPGSSCNTTVSGSSTTLSCTESSVPPGSWYYEVTPVLNSWTGEPSAASGTVVTGTATDTVSPSASPAVVGSPVTYTATVTGGGPTPTGTVTFKDGGSAISGCGTAGAVTLSGGVATCTVTYSTTGSHTITAPYGGDSNYTAAASNSVSETVNQGTATDTLTASMNPVGTGSQVTYTATVTGGGATPTGTVTFKDGGTAITGCGTNGVVTLSGGVATCAVTYNTISTHTITAAYSGDSNYTSAAGNSLTEAVERDSTTTVTANYNPLAVNASVTYTATVSGSSSTPTGSVTFKDGGTTITSCGTGGAVTLTGGVATCAVSYSATGTQSITATYGGSTTYSSSTSTTLSEVVTTDPNTLTQSTPTARGLTTRFHGTATATTAITVYYCTGSVTSCTSSSSTYVGSATATLRGTTWHATATLTQGTAYTAQAYQTDALGSVLASGVEQFTG